MKAQTNLNFYIFSIFQFLHIPQNSWIRLLQVFEFYQLLFYFFLKHMLLHMLQNKVGRGKVQSIIYFFSNWSDKHPNVHRQRKTTDTVKTICTSSRNTSVRNRCRVMKILPSRKNSRVWRKGSAKQTLLSSASPPHVVNQLISRPKQADEVMSKPTVPAEEQPATGSNIISLAK